SLEQIADTLRAYGQHANGNDPRAYVQAIQRLGQGWQAASDTVRAIGLKLNLPETAGAAAFSAALHALIGELDAGKETIEIQAHDLDSLTLDRKSLADSLESVRSQLNALREHVRALEAERDQLRNRAGQTGQEPPPQPAPRKGRI
ncbi:MAG TPA: hypothetical protein VD886_19045, partial [Herpetosiphonaceae bacterium]|nr:hypothetical protein [Herpetosiphonaceae bacterium]